MSTVRKLVGGHPLLAVALVLLVAYVLFNDQLPEFDADELLNDLADSLGQWTYLLVGVLAFLETGAFVGLVFPGETAVVVAGAIASQGETSIILTIAIVWFSAWAGDSVSFWIGTKLGREFILKHGPRFRITPERFAQVEDYFDRHGGKTILVGRFIGLVRAIAPFIAGSSGMRYRDFLPYSVLGTGMWSATFALLGYFFGSALAEQIAGRGTFIFGAVVITIVGLIVLYRYLRIPENRVAAVAWMEENRLTRPLVALGRRVKPQARFLWNRVTPGNLGLEFTTLMAALAVALFVVIGYSIIVTDDPGPTHGDETAFEIAADLQSEWLTDVNKAVSALGSSPATIIVAVVACFILAVRRHPEEVWVLFAAILFAHIAVIALKHGIERPRPPDPLVVTRGWSFPSGHAAYAIVYPWLALVMTVRLRPGRANAAALIIVGVALAVAIGLSRVYLRAHYLSDVSAGAALGVACFAICASVALVVAHVRQNQGR